MEGQISIFEYVPSVPNVNYAYKIYHEHCEHRGYIKDDEWMCGFAEMKVAKCWDDWIPCTVANCPILKEVRND